MPEPEQPIAERRRALLAGLLFGVCMTLAFPPIGLWGFALIAISPLVWCAATTKKPWRAAVFAGLGSAPFWAFEHRWLIDVTLAGWPALVVYLSLYPALFVWIVGRFAPWLPSKARWQLLIVVSPVVWVGLEVLRARVVFDGYPWFRIAHPGVAIGDVSSVYGTSGVALYFALLAAVAGITCTSDFFRFEQEQHQSHQGSGLKKQLTIPLGVGMLTLLAIPLLQVRFQPSLQNLNFHSTTVAVLQSNVPQSNKIAWSIEQKRQDFARFVAMTESAATNSGDRPIDVFVWPETMFPGMSLTPDAVAIEREARLRYADGTPTTYFYDALLELQEEIGIPMLVGAIGVEGLRIDIDEASGEVSVEQDALYNSVYLIEDGAVSEQRYDKVQLTPFGEVMPYISAIDWLEEALLAFGAQGMAFDLEAGRSTAPITIDDAAVNLGQTRRPVRIATPICFEGTSPPVMRRLVFKRDGQRKAALIVQLSNDGWFGDWKGGREQHLQLMQWIAMETRTPVIRAVNTGISTLIGADGEVVDFRAAQDQAPAILEPWTEGVVIVEAGHAESDAHQRYLGNFIDWTTLAFTALVLILPMVHPGARRDRSANGADVPVINTDDTDDHEGPAHADASDHEPRATTAEPDPDRSA